jgi:hypothetical protein
VFEKKEEKPDTTPPRPKRKITKSKQMLANASLINLDALSGQPPPKRPLNEPEIPTPALTSMPTTVGIKRKKATARYDFDEDSD